MNHFDDDTCTYCGGEGERQANHGPINWDEPRWVKCGDCDGTGHIDPDAHEAPYEAPQSWFLSSRRYAP